MTNSEILKLFSSINCARLGVGYAPHKPILILLLLDRILNGHANHFPFAKLDHDLKHWQEYDQYERRHQGQQDDHPLVDDQY